MKAAGMTSIISQKRVAVSTIASAGSKKRKVEIKATMSAPPPSSTIAVTTTDAGDATRDSSDIIENLERDTMGASWRTALEAEFTKPYFRKDPYHGVGQAHGQQSHHGPHFHVLTLPLQGLSFSVLPPTKLPGSLKNIYKQLANDIPTFSPPKTGLAHLFLPFPPSSLTLPGSRRHHICRDLTPLAKAGVLWLNTCLTVRAHKANSHSKKGWESFTDAILHAVLSRANDTGRGVVFFAWGLPAQKTCERLRIDEKKHLVLRSGHISSANLVASRSSRELIVPRSPHPSPLSAHRGFLGNGHFRRANEWLRANDRDVIDWTALGFSTACGAASSSSSKSGWLP
ncbi:uracil-DNA glycosylase-like protein [Lanmaoa asiatica]|nr:uracil-DNA glycosylase-like protein [Lanmaoa asiatica]